MKYRIDMYTTARVYGSIEVEADSQEQAEELALKVNTSGMNIHNNWQHTADTDCIDFADAVVCSAACYEDGDWVEIEDQ